MSATIFVLMNARFLISPSLLSRSESLLEIIDVLVFRVPVSEIQYLNQIQQESIVQTS